MPACIASRLGAPPPDADGQSDKVDGMDAMGAMDGMDAMDTVDIFSRRGATDFGF